ncbi:hypothetical protein D3H35_28120 [Cohnella faecalis]|uniref:Response regulator n=1 Tax=Cohnella faecalis TaxID=2315694 RepID=A0A398CBF3_9BACL|nr:hypothetical protein D3H35_28120 [Cohnella faecalis]
MHDRQTSRRASGDESIADPQAKGSGIGIRNVNQRIRYIFGKDYGVTSIRFRRRDSRPDPYRLFIAKGGISNVENDHRGRRAVDSGRLEKHAVGTMGLHGRWRSGGRRRRLALVEETRPHFIITDIRMPGMDWARILQDVKERTRKLRF